MSDRRSSPSATQVPRATYRLQFNEHFRLTDGLALVPYLHELGISHIYASPLFMARPHSAHGYDVCDFGRLNPELGTEDDLAKLETALRQRGMGLVLDIVPNHMGIGGPENRWWWDVLTHGESSAFAGYFDIDWRPADPRLQGRVLAPVLDDSFEHVFKRGGFQVVDEGGTFLLRQGGQRFPLSPDSLPQSLARIQSRQSSHADIAPALAELNANNSALNELIRRQHYLPVSGREADTRLNYRRFFNVATLAGLRMEDQRVFDDAHRLVRDWLRRGWLDGLRVDHPDGLLDPDEYLRRLRSEAPNAWIIVEKILMPDETLPDSWPVAGTTGYDFLNHVNRLFIDSEGEEALTRIYSEFTGEPTNYPALVDDKKLLVLREMFTAEINCLKVLLDHIRAGDARFKNLSSAGLDEALMEMAACLPVYRTYIRPGDGGAGQIDLALIQQAVTSRPRTTARPGTGTLQSFKQDFVAAPSWRSGGGIRPAFPTTDRPGHGQRGRGHRFLLFQPADLAQRSWRRPRTVRPFGRSLPRNLPPPAGALARQPAGQFHPRHQTQRRRARENWPSFRDSRNLGPDCPRLVRHERVLSPRQSAGPQPGIFFLPDAGRRVAPVHGTRAGLHGKGGLRGERTYQLDAAESRL